MSEAAGGTMAGGRAAGGPAADQAIPWRRLGVLAVVALGLGLVALRVIPARLAPPVQQVPDPLLAIDPAAVQEVDVRGEVEGHLARAEDGEWTVTGPAIVGVQTIARGPIDDFLQAVRTIPRLTQFVEPDLAQFGLAPPHGQVMLRVAGGAEETIAIGDRNPALTALYVQVLPAADVIVVGSVLYWEYDKLVGSIRREAVRMGDAADPAVGR